MSLNYKDFTILFIGSVGLLRDRVFILLIGATLLKARSLTL